jgi:16S rRNA processing protein RimM
MNDKVYVAKIGKTVGLKGQLKLYIDSDFPEQFKKNKKFITTKNQTIQIETFNHINNTVKFVGIDNIDDAKKLINKELFVTQAQSKEDCVLDQNQFFWFDLIDCDIIENNLNLGKVSDIHRFPTSDYFEIKTNQVLVDKDKARIFLIPYIPEYILGVDIKNKNILVKGALDILDAS